jgi:hypothetical protein
MARRIVGWRRRGARLHGGCSSSWAQQAAASRPPPFRRQLPSGDSEALQWDLNRRRAARGLRERPHRRGGGADARTRCQRLLPRAGGARPTMYLLLGHVSCRVRAACRCRPCGRVRRVQRCGCRQLPSALRPGTLSARPPSPHVYKARSTLAERPASSTGSILHDLHPWLLSFRVAVSPAEEVYQYKITRNANINRNIPLGEPPVLRSSTAP